MKYIIKLAALWACLPVFASNSTDSIPEPEYINQVYHYDKNQQKLFELEKSTAEMKAKIKLVGGGMPAYTFEGAQSSTRIPNGTLSFMVSVGNNMMMSDPSSTITLYKLDAKKNKREAPMSNYGMGGSDNTIDLKFKKTKSGAYEIVVAEKLEKGEYAFINMAQSQGGKMTAYTFGVD